MNRRAMSSQDFMAVPYRFETLRQRGIELFVRNESLLFARADLCWTATALTTALGQKENAKRNSRRVRSCASLFDDRTQECIHRNSATRNLTQSLSEAQGRFFSTGKDVAQMCVRAIGAIGKLPDGHTVLFRPAEHGV